MLALFLPFRIFLGLVLGSYCRKRHDVTMPWPFENIFHRTNTVKKFKLILPINTMGCCGLACVVWLKSCEFSKRKSVLIVGNSGMMCLLQKFLNLTYFWTLFSIKLSKLVGHFYCMWEAKSIWKKSKPLKQLFDALETNSLSFMTVLKFFLKFFSIKNVRKWNAMWTSNNDLVYFKSFLKHDKGINRKLR